MLKYLTACNNHEYGSKSIYRQHMDCLNTSWLTTIMSTAARVSIINTWNQHMECLNTSWLISTIIINTWNAYGTTIMSTYRQHMECLNTSWLQQSWVRHQEHLSFTHGMLKSSWLRVRQQEYLSLTHGMLKYLMANNNNKYGSKSIYHQHMECLNTSWLKTIMSTAARVPIVNTWNA